MSLGSDPLVNGQGSRWRRTLDAALDMIKTVIAMIAVLGGAWAWGSSRVDTWADGRAAATVIGHVQEEHVHLVRLERFEEVAAQAAEAQTQASQAATAVKEQRAPLGMLLCNAAGGKARMRKCKLRGVEGVKLDDLDGLMDAVDARR